MIDDLVDDGPRHHDRITSNPKVMVGKPVVKGTRIPVAAVLDQLSVELDLRDLLEAYMRTSSIASSSARSGRFAFASSRVAPARRPD